jgi:DNA-binding CsgD family transcriptional regulator
MSRTAQPALAAAIAALGRPAFPSALLAAIAAAVAHDAAALMLFRKAAPPAVLVDHLRKAERSILYGDYLAGVYALSPFHRLALGLRSPRVARVRDIAPSGFAASEYYQRYFARIGVADMLGVLLPVSGSDVVFASLSRATGQRRFSRADVAAVDALLPVLAALVRRQGEFGLPLAPAPEPAPARRPAGAGALTAREADVVQLILAGHSTRSLAATLGISAETVRVHRRHIYAKLSISSQAELFRWFLAQGRA